MLKRRNLILYSALVNIIGMAVSMLIGIANDNGGAAMGYIFVGFAITGLLTISILILGLFFNGRKLYGSGSKIFLALILMGFSLWQISLIRLLSLW